MCRLSRKTARERCSNQLHLNRIRVICPVTRKKNMINETLTTLARCTTIASLRVLVLSGGRMAGFRSSVPQTNGNAPPLAQVFVLQDMSQGLYLGRGLSPMWPWESRLSTARRARARCEDRGAWGGQGVPVRPDQWRAGPGERSTGGSASRCRKGRRRGPCARPSREGAFPPAGGGPAPGRARSGKPT